MYSILGDRHVLPDVNKQILNVDANSLMNGRILPTGDFKKLPFPNTEGQQSCNYPLDQIVDLLQISDDNEYEFFIEYDLENPAENKQTIENFPFVSLSSRS